MAKRLNDIVSGGAERLRGSVHGLSDRLSDRMNGVSDLGRRRRIVLIVFVCGLAVIALNLLRLHIVSGRSSVTVEEPAPVSGVEGDSVFFDPGEF